MGSADVRSFFFRSALASGVVIDDRFVLLQMVLTSDFGTTGKGKERT
jgi:hypothetical protein